MRQSIDIAINDLRVFLRDTGNLIGLLAIPVLMTFIIGFVSGGGFAGGGESRILADVIDGDDSDLSAQFIDSLRQANSALVLCPMDNDDEDICQLGDDPDLDRERAESRINDSTTRALIEIPEGFANRVRAFEPVSVSLLATETFNTSNPVRGAVDAAVLRANGAVVAARVGSDVAVDAVGFEEDADRRDFESGVYERAGDIWAENPVEVRYQSTTQNDESASGGLDVQAGFGQSVPGMGSMFVMFAAFGGMTLLIVERKQGTLGRLAVMPLSRAQLLGGEIIGRFVLGLLQFLVVFLIGLLMGVDFGNDPLAFLLIVVTYTLAITALSFALGSRLENEAQASGLALLLSLVLASLGGAWWPLEIVPQPMQIAGHISPVAWAMDGFQQLIFYGGGLGDVLGYVGVLAVLAVIFFIVGIWQFKYE